MSKKHRKSSTPISDFLMQVLFLPFQLLGLIIKGAYRFIKWLVTRNQSPTHPEGQLYQVELETVTPYCKKPLLTNNELNFYRHLKPIAERKNLIILTKIRMADLVEPTSKNRNEYMSAFGKIKAKHVDFALASPDNCKIELLIELDDRSHVPGNERDAFVEKVYRSTGYKLYRTWSEANLEKDIEEALGEPISTNAPDITELLAALENPNL